MTITIKIASSSLCVCSQTKRFVSQHQAEAALGDAEGPCRKYLSLWMFCRIERLRPDLTESSPQFFTSRDLYGLSCLVSEDTLLEAFMVIKMSLAPN